MPTRLGDNNEATFIVNKYDEYSFAASNILMKLPNPLTVEGSSPKNHHLKFSFDFNPLPASVPLRGRYLKLLYYCTNY